MESPRMIAETEQQQQEKETALSPSALHLMRMMERKRHYALPPVRCFTCGKPIGHMFGHFMLKTSSATLLLLEPGEAKRVLEEELGVTRSCCKRHFLSQQRG